MGPGKRKALCGIQLIIFPSTQNPLTFHYFNKDNDCLTFEIVHGQTERHSPTLGLNVEEVGFMSSWNKFDTCLRQDVQHTCLYGDSVHVI